LAVKGLVISGNSNNIYPTLLYLSFLIL